MKLVKMIGPMTVVAAAVMALAATASATTLTSPAGTTYTGTISATSEGHTILENTSIGLKIECNASLSATIASHGSGVTAKANISSLSITSCTNGYLVTVLANGSLEVHNVSGGKNGTLTGTGTELTWHTPLGFSCTYKTTATDLGTITNSTATGGKATLDINSTLPRTGDSALCGTSAVWKGSFVFNTPSTLYVDP